jgi:hypothetical protein
MSAEPYSTGTLCERDYHRAPSHRLLHQCLRDNRTDKPDFADLAPFKPSKSTYRNSNPSPEFGSLGFARVRLASFCKFY